MQSETPKTTAPLKGAATYVRRDPPTTRELMERRKLQQEEARTAWQEYEQRQRDVDANTARLRAERLAREKSGTAA